MTEAPIHIHPPTAHPTARHRPQIIAELLYLNYESQDRPIYMYINSPGISAPDGRAIGFDTEAFAIADVMQYIRAPVATVCVGQCYGSAAMLLAAYVPARVQ